MAVWIVAPKLKFYMKNIFALLSMILVAGFLSISCEKEDPNPEYPFTIHVKTYSDSISVNNVYVRVFAPVPGNSVIFEGVTNELGKVRFKYDQEAVFIVRATRGEDPPSYIGCNTIRLQPNEEVTQSVYIVPYDPEVEGC